MTEKVSYNNQPQPVFGGDALYSAISARPVPEGVYFDYLSPEALIAFVESQLRSLDDQIFNHMKEVEGRRKAADALSEVSGTLKQCEKFADGNYLENLKYKAYGVTAIYVNGAKVDSRSNTPQGQKELEELIQQYSMLQTNKVEIKEIQQPDPAAKEQYEAIVGQFENAAKKLEAQGYHDLAKKCQQVADDLKVGKNVGSETIAGLVNQIESTMNSLSSASEMTMIRLQELMQQRSRVIMFVTNAMASMNEASRKIIDNTR